MTLSMILMLQQILMDFNALKCNEIKRNGNKERNI